MEKIDDAFNWDLSHPGDLDHVEVDVYSRTNNPNRKFRRMSRHQLNEYLNRFSIALSVTQLILLIKLVWFS